MLKKYTNIYKTESIQKHYLLTYIKQSQYKNLNYLNYFIRKLRLEERQ